jgi:hypothetical protein
LGVRQDLHGLVDRLPEGEIYTAREAPRAYGGVSTSAG